MNKSHNQKTPSVLILTGMHRSGTSFISAMLQSAGLHIGRNLLGQTNSNVKGHFENIDFLNFHKTVLQSQEIGDKGWTLQDHIVLEDHHIAQAKELISNNAISSTWGWKDPRTTLFLDFWADLLPEASFLLVYRAPWAVVDSLYRRLEDTPFQREPELAIKLWLHYNQKIIDFYNRFSDRCILANLKAVVDNQNQYIATINRQVGTVLRNPDPNIFDPSLLQTYSSDSHRISLLDYYFPEAIEMYQELEARGWQPDDTLDLSWRDQIQAEPYRIWVFQDWVNLRRVEALYRQQEDEFRETKLHSQTVQKELEQSTSQLKQTQIELAQTQSRLHETEGLLGETKSVLKQSQLQLHQTEAVLQQFQSRLQQTRQDLNQTQSREHRTRIELEQRLSQLHQTQEELEQSHILLRETGLTLFRQQAQLHQTEVIVKQYQTRLRQSCQEQQDTERVLQQSQHQLHQTEELLDQYQSQLQQSRQEQQDTERVLQQSQHQLHQTEALLEEYRIQFKQKQVNLEQNHIQLHQNEVELKRYCDELNRVKQELERSRFQQAVFGQPDETYQLLVWEAWNAYRNDNLSDMARFLQQSIKHKQFSRTETVMNWLKRFSQFSAEHGETLDTEALTVSAEWQQLVRRSITVKSKIGKQQIQHVS